MPKPTPAATTTPDANIIALAAELAGVAGRWHSACDAFDAIGGKRDPVPMPEPLRKSDRDRALLGAALAGEPGEFFGDSDVRAMRAIAPLLARGSVSRAETTQAYVRIREILKSHAAWAEANAAEQARLNVTALADEADRLGEKQETLFKTLLAATPTTVEGVIAKLQGFAYMLDASGLIASSARDMRETGIGEFPVCARIVADLLALAPASRGEGARP